MANPLQWFKFHAEMPDHPKSDALAAATGDEWAWAKVAKFWCWCAIHRPDGDLTGMSDTVIGMRAGVPAKDAAAFGMAMRQFGWIDGDRLHDWADEQAAHVKVRERERAKKARQRVRSEVSPGTSRGTDVGTSPGDVTGDVQGGPLSTERGEVRGKRRDQVQVPMSTVVDVGVSETLKLTSPEQPKGASKDVLDVWDHYKSKIAPRAALSNSRKALVGRSLKLYSVEELKRSIDGYRVSPHHNGQNDRGAKYLALELILRDAGHIEAGWTYLAAGPSPAPFKPKDPLERPAHLPAEAVIAKEPPPTTLEERRAIMAKAKEQARLRVLP